MRKFISIVKKIEVAAHFLMILIIKKPFSKCEDWHW